MPGSKGTRLGAAGKKAVNRGNASSAQRISAYAKKRQEEGLGRRKKRGRQTRQAQNQNSPSTADEGKWNNKSPDQIGLIDSVSVSPYSHVAEYNLSDVGGTNSETVKSFKGQIDKVDDKLKHLDRINLRRLTPAAAAATERYIKSLRREINGIETRVEENFELGKWENKFRLKLDKLRLLLGKRVIEFEEKKKEILANQQRRAKERGMKIAKNKVNKQKRAKEREKKEAKNKVNKKKKDNARASALSNARKTDNSKIKEIEKLKKEILKTNNSTNMYNKVEELEDLLDNTINVKGTPKGLDDLYLPLWANKMNLSIPSNTDRNKISKQKMKEIKSAIKDMPNLKTLATNNNASASASALATNNNASAKKPAAKKPDAKEFIPTTNGTNSNSVDNNDNNNASAKSANKKPNPQNAGSKKKKATKKKATKKKATKKKATKKKATKKKATKKKATKKKKSTTTKKKKSTKTKKKVQEGGFFESLFSIFF